MNTKEIKELESIYIQQMDKICRAYKSGGMSSIGLRCMSLFANYLCNIEKAIRYTSEDCRDEAAKAFEIAESDIRRLRAVGNINGGEFFQLVKEKVEPVVKLKEKQLREVARQFKARSLDSFLSSVGGLA